MKTFKEFINEAKIVVKDTKDITFNVGSFIQIVDENDKNSGNAKIKKALKNSYTIEWNGKQYKVDKSNISINKHGQAQSSDKNLIEL